MMIHDTTATSYSNDVIKLRRNVSLRELFLHIVHIYYHTAL